VHNGERMKVRYNAILLLTTPCRGCFSDNLQFKRKSNQHCSNNYFTIIFPQIKSNQMLVLDERGKPEYPGKNLS